MNDSPRNENLEPLLNRLSVDELADAEWHELAAMLAEDDDSIRSYLEAVQWRQSLEHLVRGQAAPDPGTIRLIDETFAKESHTESPEPENTSLDLPRGEKYRPASRRWRDMFSSWTLAVSVAFLAGAGLAALTFQGVGRWSPAEVARSPQKGQPMAFVPPAPLVQESQLGKISGLSLEASADGLVRPLQVGQELRCGEVVQLTEGFMRVALHAGPELIVEGPAEFSIIGGESVFVRVGRVAASHTGRLLLQSPLLTAECNDADLVFIADEKTATNVYAYKGVVTMRSIAHHSSAGEKLGVLHEGQGLLVQPDMPKSALPQLATVPPSGVVRSWAKVEAQLSEYERLVLSDRPIAYWPLYRVCRNRRVLDLTQNGFDGQAIGNWPVELKDSDKTTERGAYFNGESYIEPDRKPPIDLRSGFTVEGWAKVNGGPAFQSIFTSRWVLNTHTPHQQCLGFTLYAGDDDRWQFWTGNGRYGELWQYLYSDAKVVRNRWTHVVASFEPQESAEGMPAESLKGIVHIYVDGKHTGQGVHEMSLMDLEWPARIGAAEFVPNSLTAWLFRGSLRDIAVYDYPLEPKRIEAHYEVGDNAG